MQPQHVESAAYMMRISLQGLRAGRGVRRLIRPLTDKQAGGQSPRPKGGTGGWRGLHLAALCWDLAAERGVSCDNDRSSEWLSPGDTNPSWIQLIRQGPSGP